MNLLGGVAFVGLNVHGRSRLPDRYPLEFAFGHFLSQSFAPLSWPKISLL
jgi:hypothetical protein